MQSYKYNLDSVCQHVSLGIRDGNLRKEWEGISRALASKEISIEFLKRKTAQQKQFFYLLDDLILSHPDQLPVDLATKFILAEEPTKYTYSVSYLIESSYFPRDRFLQPKASPTEAKLNEILSAAPSRAQSVLRKYKRHLYKRNLSVRTLMPYMRAATKYEIHLESENLSWNSELALASFAAQHKGHSNSASVYTSFLSNQSGIERPKFVQPTICRKTPKEGDVRHLFQHWKGVATSNESSLVELRNATIGLLILVHGLSASRVVRLTSNSIGTRGPFVTITAGGSSFDLDGFTSSIVKKYLERKGNELSTHYLFPGQKPNSHLNPTSVNWHFQKFNLSALLLLNFHNSEVRRASKPFRQPAQLVHSGL